MLRQQALRQLPRQPSLHLGCAPRRTFLNRAKSSSGRAVERLSHRRLAQEQQDYERMRRNFLTAGAIAGVVSFIYTSVKLKQALDKPAKLDSTLPPNDPLLTDARRKVVVRDEEGREIVPTGNSTVPTFPRTINLRPVSAAPAPASATAIVNPLASEQTTEYTLVGLGTRSVSFLSINVYVVGFYVATADIAALQARLVKRINPIATTLIANEKDDLRQALLDPAQSEEVWNELLREGIPARSAFRILPVRDTDFHHLRDGFVRAIQARSDKIQNEAQGDGGADSVAVKDKFGESVRQFRHAFNRGKVPKAKELLLARDGDGKLGIIYSDGSPKRERELIGTVDDERVSRALWLNWLGGKKVASEPARASIVDGIMEFVERPVGTVASQVV
ncbi:hypothetical protein GGTG_06534 [Gaeumannomyces tritici R3-111a-1]|uniref:Chalcone isomerase domain-containing protein n=1 Tax=Gaeumannomyces tritici (strain R3-111a-1) TaxID=644352 RepID=J3NZ34_GAET3|nr:hypothetical protein GGTG_06534 [Gaeumannomyces tritici R3-111a-1]EJT76617.1 hypothetical protein GGTG_06534 [Gaeumannomyces tritici R3-111a-1]